MTAHARETSVDDRARARRIVVRAADATQVDSVKAWLRDDSTGAWERLAADYLADTAVKAAELQLPADTVDDEIANRLCQLARVATRNEAAGRKAAPRRRAQP